MSSSIPHEVPSIVHSASPKEDSPASPEPTTAPTLEGGSRDDAAVRDVAPGDIARILRAVLGLPPDQPVPGELAAFVQRPMPAIVRGVDAGGWIAWCLAGVSVFALDQPPIMRRIYKEAKRIAMSLAMLRSDGNITVAAQSLGTSRRALREGLRTVGLYPWLGVDDKGPRSDAVVLSLAGEEASIGKDEGAIDACTPSTDSDSA